MLKKYLTYFVIFIACFLSGLLLAFAWSRFVGGKHTEPLSTAPTSTVAHPTSSGHEVMTAASATPATAPSLSAHPTGTELKTSAAQPDRASQSALHATSGPAVDPGCDIVLLMDSSGSMKRTDPRNYRKNAAKLFISLLGRKDRISVISFGDATTLLIPLTQNSEQNRKALFSAVDRIASKELFTNITAAVQKGYEALAASTKRSRLMIMMSDGRIDLGSREKDSASKSDLMRILPGLDKEHIPLYTVAFTEESDKVLLESIANATSGFFRFARADKDTHVMFAAIFEKIKSPDTVPFDNESFAIDRDIREATILVTKNPGTALSLLDPVKKLFTASRHSADISWFESSVFDMITIQTPTAGRWSVKLSTNEGNKVYVLTNLHLKTSFGGQELVQGQATTFDVWLEKEGGIVKETALVESTAFSAELIGPEGVVRPLSLAPSGTTVNAQLESGKVTGTLTPERAGEYTMKILAQGKTFTRVASIPFKVAAAAQTAAQIPAVPAQPIAPQSDNRVSWTDVLIRFGIINLVVIGMAVGGMGIRIMIIKMRAKR